MTARAASSAIAASLAVVSSISAASAVRRAAASAASAASCWARAVSVSLSCNCCCRPASSAATRSSSRPRLALRDRQMLQLGRRLRLGLAQSGQGGRGLGLLGRGDRGGLGQRVDGALRVVQRRIGVLLARGRVQPMQMRQGRLGAADMVLQVAIAGRLAGLLLQRGELALQGHDHVVEAREIGLRGLEAQLGLMAARMQAGDARRLFEQRAAVDRLGVDDRADAALAHQGGRMRAGRDVGEQDLHVAGAGLAAVHLVGRAHAAVDAPRNLDLGRGVELRRDLAVVVVEQQLDPRRRCGPGGCRCRRK